jgi:phosphatidate phosphatase APP1
MELAIGEPRVKQVSGTVRDDFGKPVADARITVIIDAREALTVRSDSDGHYSLSTAAGAQIVASNGKKVGRALVGRANIDSEQVDLQLFDPASAGYP